MADFAREVEKFLLNELKKARPVIKKELDSQQFVDMSKAQFGIKAITKKGYTP